MKPFKETNLGEWLGKNAPDILDTVGEILPDKGALGILKNVVNKVAGLSSEQKEEFNKLAADHEIEYFKEDNRANEAEQHELTERQKNDMTSDSWWSKNVRPLSLVYLLCLYTILVILEAAIPAFHVADAYKDMLGNLLMMIFAFYFGSRMVEKTTQMVTRKK